MATLVTLALTGFASLSGMLGSLERASLSTRYSLRQVPRPTGIVVVKIDDESFDKLATRWPFPRSLHARAIDKLHAAGAKEIVYDVQFTEPSADPRRIEALYRSIGKSGRSDPGDQRERRAGRGPVSSEATRTLRRFMHALLPQTSRPPPAASSRASPTRYQASRASRSQPPNAREATSLTPARFESGKALIDYRGGIGAFPEVSFWRVLRGTAPAGVFRGKIVVVGATAPSLQDLHATPTSGSGLMPGPEVQANAIWTALHGNPLRDAPGWLTAIAVLLAALVAPLAAWRLERRQVRPDRRCDRRRLPRCSPSWRSTRAWSSSVTTPLLALALGGASHALSQLLHGEL